jgi:tRNA 2-thiouridine synthesizing protein A
VDARGLSCPEPVLRARKAIAGMAAGGELEVLVESVTSRENVRRTATSMGCTVDVQEHEDGFRLVITKQ